MAAGSQINGAGGSKGLLAPDVTKGCSQCTQESRTDSTDGERLRFLNVGNVTSIPSVDGGESKRGQEKLDQIPLPSWSRDVIDVSWQEQSFALL